MQDRNEMALVALLEQKRREVKALEQAIVALGLTSPISAPTRPLSSKGHPFGNGEPDAELAAAAGINLIASCRPDKWRKYLTLRRKGIAAGAAAAKVVLSPNTAARLEPLT